MAKLAWRYHRHTKNFMFGWQRYELERLADSWRALAWELNDKVKA